MTPSSAAPGHFETPARFDLDALRAGHLVIRRHRDRFSAYFTDIAYERYPQLREIFPRDDERSAVMLSAVIDAILAVADDAERLAELTDRLGVDNRTIGLREEHYAPIGHAMVLAARSLGDEAWSRDVERSWVEAYDVVAELMVSAAVRDRAQGQPWLTGQVVERARITPDMAVLLVRLDEAVIARPGQHALVSSPEVPAVWRPYHLVPVPADAHEVEIHIQVRRPDGLAAALIRAEVGDEVRMGRPQGTDLLRSIGDRNVLVVTAGTGIAPGLALVADPGTARDGRRVHLFYGGRTVEDLAALDRLTSIGRRFPRLDVVPVVTTSGDEDRLARSMAAIVGSYADWRRHRVLVAGPTEVLSPTLARLEAAGVTPEQIIRADRRAPYSDV